MTGIARIGALVREAASAARAQRALTAFTALVAAGMVLLVLLTVGRTVAAQAEVIASIDDAGTRSIVYRLQPGAQVSPAVLTRIGTLGGVASAAAFGPASDAASAAAIDGPRVATRWVATFDPAALGLPPPEPSAAPTTRGWGTPSALHLLGLVDGTGPIALPGNPDPVVAGAFDPPASLEFLGPAILVPVSPPSGPVDARAVVRPPPRGEPETSPLDGSGEVALVVVVAASPAQVAPLARTVGSVLGAVDAQAVTAETSEAFARLRGLIDQQLSVYSYAMLVGSLLGGGLLLAATLQATVVLRRKDFGRRRALGASQRLVAALVVAQAALIVAAGAGAGALGGYAALALSGTPLPRPTFGIALVVLSIATGAIAAVIPALVAARRDPLTELRVP